VLATLGTGSGGGSSTGGSIVTDSSGSITTTGTSGHAGGAVNLVAYSSISVGGSGDISVGGTIASGGNGAGANGNVTLIAGGTATSGNMTSITTSGTINTTGSTASIGSGQINITTAAPQINGGASVIVKNGSISAGTFTASNTLQTPGVMLAGLTASGVAINVTTAGNITLGDAIQNSGGAGSINISSTGGTLTASSGLSISASASSGSGSVANGGSINLNVADISLTGTGSTSPIALSANGFGTGNGGTIKVDVGETNGIDIGGVNDSTAQLSLSAQSGNLGGNGGVLSVTSSALLVVSSTSGLNAGPKATGQGAQISLTAGSAGSGDIQIAGGGLSVNGGGTGAGGSLTLIVNSANPFVVDGNASSGSPGSYINGALSATSTSGAGGSITVINHGGLTSNGGVTITTPTTDILVTSASGKGGSITLSGAAGVGGLSGNVTLGPGDLNANGGSTGSAANGGNISITGSVISVNGTGLAQLNANGAGTGSGGTVTVTQLAIASALTVGSQSGSGTQLQISVQSGAHGGNGGVVSVTSAGDLNVDPGAISANPTTSGLGAQLTLSANGNLAIAGVSGSSGNLSANGAGTGAGGSITLISNSTSAFVVTGTSTDSNYIGGTLSANGGKSSGAAGSISITNNGGGVTVAAPSTDISVTTNSGNGGSITLVASGGILTIGSAAGTSTLSAMPKGAGTGGNITLSGASLAFTTVNIVAGGTVAITSAASGDNSLSGSTVSAANVALIAPNGDFVLDTSSISGTKSIALITGNSINTGNLSGFKPTPTLILDATGAGSDVGSAGSPLSLPSTVVDLTSSANGSVYITATKATTLINSVVQDINYTNSAGSTYFLSAPSLITSGTVSQPASVTAPNVILAASTGSLGTSATNTLSINAQNVTLSSQSGSVWASDISTGDTNGNVNFVGITIGTTNYANSASGIYSFNASKLSTAGFVTSLAVGTVSGSNVALYSSGGFNLGGSVSSGNAANDFVALVSNSSITSVLTLSAPNLVFVTTGASSTIGTSANRLAVIQSSNITADAQGKTGSVFISDTSTGKADVVSLANATVNGVTYTNTAGSTYSFIANATGTSGMTIATPSTVKVSAASVDFTSSGNLSLAGGVTGTTSVAFITTDSITSLGPVTTPTLTLATTGASTNIGSTIVPLVVNASTITLSAPGGLVNVIDNSVGVVPTGGTTAQLNIANSTVNATLYSNTALGAFTFNAPVIPPSRLLVSASTVDIIGGSVNIKTTGSVSLQGSVTTNGTVTSTSNSGDITVISSGDITVASMSATKDINLSTIANNGQISYTANLVAKGNITINANGGGNVLGLNQTLPTAISSNTGTEWTFLLGGASSPDGKTLYVPDYTSETVNGNTVAGTLNGTINIINTVTGQQLTTGGSVSLGVGTAPEGVAVSPDGRYVYVAESGTNGHAIAVIDTHNGNAVSLIGIPTINAIAANPENVAISPDGKTLYVVSDIGTLSTAGTAVLNVITLTPANFSTSTISTVTLPGGTAINQTGGVAVNPQNTLAFVSTSGNKAVYVINLANDTVLGSPISLSGFGSANPMNITLNQAGTSLYVAEASLNRTTQTILGSIGVINVLRSSPGFGSIVAAANLPQETTANGNGSFPQGISVNSTGTDLMVQSTYFSGMSDVSTGLNSYLYFINTGQGPDGFGSTSFSTLVPNTNALVGTVNNMTTYTSNTINLTAANTLSVVQSPTLAGANINLTTGGGYIIASYQANGSNGNPGTVTAHTGKAIVGNLIYTGSAILSNVGTAASVVEASSAGNLLQIGSVGQLTISGALTAPNVMVQTTQNSASLILGANIGSAGGSVVLGANGTGTISNATGVSPNITGKTVQLLGVSGDIGAPGSRIQVAAQNLSGLTGGNIYVNSTSAVTLAGISAGGNLDITSSGNIIVAAGTTLTSPAISLATNAGSSASISVAGQVDNSLAGTVNLTVNGSGSIFQLGTTSTTVPALIEAGTLSLTLASGSAGSSVAALKTDTNILSVQTTATGAAVQNVYLNNTGDLNLSGATIKGSFSLVNSGNLIIGGVSGGSLKAASISITNSSGTISDNTSTASILAAPTVSLRNTGDIGSVTVGAVAGVPVSIIANSVTLNSSAGNVNVSDTSTSAISLGASSSGTTTSGENSFLFTAASAPTVTISGALSSPNITLTAGTSPAVTNLVIAANVGVSGSSASTTVLNATGNITQSTGSLLNSSLTLNGGNIGTAAAPIRSAATTLTATANNSTTNASLYVSNTNASGLSLDNISANSLVHISNTLGDIGGVGTLSGTAVNLTASSGDIGTSVAPLQTQTGLLTVNAGGTGNVYINNSGTGSGLTVDASSSTGAFSVTDNTGTLTVSGKIQTSSNTPLNIQSATNNISLVETLGNVQINSNLSAFGGSILVQAQAATGNIGIANNVQITTLVSAGTKGIPANGTIGTISLFDGASPTTPATNQASSAGFVTVTNTAPGAVYYGANPSGVVPPGSAPNTKLNADGANVYFNSASVNQQITLGSGDTITADPVSAGALVGNAATLGLVAGNAITLNGNSSGNNSVGSVSNFAPLQGANAITNSAAPSALFGVIASGTNASGTTTLGNAAQFLSSAPTVSFSPSGMPLSNQLNPAAASSLFGSPTQSTISSSTGATNGALNGSLSGAAINFATNGSTAAENSSLGSQFGPAAPSSLFGVQSAQSISASSTMLGNAAENTSVIGSTVKGSAAHSTLFGAPAAALESIRSTQTDSCDLSQLQIFDSHGLRSSETASKTKLGANNSLQGFVSQKAVGPVEMTLKQGSMLFASDRPVKLKTSVGQISIAAKAIALVVATREGVALYNLHDDRGGEVSVNGTTLALGEQVLLTRGHDRNYEDVNPLGFITHTNLSSKNLTNGYQMIRSDFSIMSALAGLKPALQLGSSSDPDNKLAVRLIKNAAVLMQIKPGSPYRRMSNDRPMLSMQP